jgi:uncharacterized phage protein (TIGR01671 family)
MREIKFRAWDKENNKWVIDIGLSTTFIDNKDIVNLESRGFEVMQFTGLKDKNGKEIYEGDIFKSKKGKIFEVIFQDGTYAFGNSKKGYYLLGSFDIKKEELEVIGNIYKNKELLEENK